MRNLKELSTLFLRHPGRSQPRSRWLPPACPQLSGGPAVPRHGTESPFSPGVTKPIGMQLRSVLITSLQSPSTGDMAPLRSAKPRGVPAPSTQMSTRLCPASGGGDGAGDSPCPQGRGLSLYQEWWLSTGEPVCDPRAHLDAVTTARGSSRAIELGVISALTLSPAGPSASTKHQTPSERQRCVVWKVNPWSPERGLEGERASTTGRAVGSRGKALVAAEAPLGSSGSLGRGPQGAGRAGGVGDQP